MAKQAQTQVAAASLDLLESLCQTERPQWLGSHMSQQHKGLLRTVLWGGFRAALWLGSGWKPCQRDKFYGAEQKRPVRSLSTCLNIPYSILLVFLWFFTSSCFPSPWQGSSEQRCSASCHYTFTSSLPGNFPSISTAVLPSKWAQIIFPVNI